MIKESPSVIPGWERKIVFFLGAFILLSGMYQTLFGEREIGILTLICFAAISAPRFFTRDYIKKFPVEIEILLFFMVLFQYVLGEARDFYVTIPYYDKIVHYMLPLFLGIIGFLIFYTLHVTEKLKTSLSAMMVIIILITMGIGAGWEIFEYLSDVFLAPNIEGWHHFQGNAQQDPLTDTMTDLIDDTLGAIFGAALGLWVMKRHYGNNGRMASLIDEVDKTFERKK